MSIVLRAADRYAYEMDCGSTAYSVGTVSRGKRDLYTPGSRPAFAGGGLARLTNVALLAGAGRPCLPNSNQRAAYSQQNGEPCLL
jgi:hypothetical protein